MKKILLNIFLCLISVVCLAANENLKEIVDSISKTQPFINLKLDSATSQLFWIDSVEWANYHCEESKKTGWKSPFNEVEYCEFQPKTKCRVNHFFHTSIKRSETEVYYYFHSLKEETKLKCEPSGLKLIFKYNNSFLDTMNSAYVTYTLGLKSGYQKLDMHGADGKGMNFEFINPFDTISAVFPSFKEENYGFVLINYYNKSNFSEELMEEIRFKSYSNHYLYIVYSTTRSEEAKQDFLLVDALTGHVWLRGLGEIELQMKNHELFLKIEQINLLKE